jgi:hypothetical protein
MMSEEYPITFFDFFSLMVNLSPQKVTIQEIILDALVLQQSQQFLDY